MIQHYITSLPILYFLSRPCIYIIFFLFIGTILTIFLHLYFGNKRTRINLFSESRWIKHMQDRNIKKRKQQELITALANQEFFLEFQPIVRLSDKEVVAMEALIRWNHPDKGILYPASFLDDLVKCSLMDKVGQFVIQSAFATFADVLKQKPNFRLTINLSPEEMLVDGFIDFLLNEADKHQIQISHIYLEITETSLLLGDPKIKDIVEMLREKGFHISLDDFGTGFANFSKLHKLPVEGLKMDRSFLSKEEAKSYIILQIMLKLSNALELLVVTEGVEEEKQFHTLRDMGYKYAQRYYFGRPKLIHEFVQLYI